MRNDKFKKKKEFPAYRCGGYMESLQFPCGVTVLSVNIYFFSNTGNLNQCCRKPDGNQSCRRILQLIFCVFLGA